MKTNDSSAVAPVVFGIGNPLIDVVFSATDEDLSALSLDKGIMHLVTEARQREILDHFSGIQPVFRPGGSAPNTLLACGGLGVPAVVSGKIGDDDFGDTYENRVLEYGIVSRLARGCGTTGSSIILVTPDGERTMNTHLGMCQEFDRDDVDVDLLRRARFLYFTGYMWDTDVQKGAILYAVEVAKAAGVRVVFDVGDPFAVQRYRDDFLALLANDVDIAFANRTEATLLFATDDEAKQLHELGNLVPLAALKTGKDGSIAITGSKIERVPGRPVTPKDTTGAGDMYAAGFLTALAADHYPRDAAALAGTLAEEIIQETGAQFSVDRIQQLRSELL